MKDRRLAFGTLSARAPKTRQPPVVPICAGTPRLLTVVLLARSGVYSTGTPGTAAVQAACSHEQGWRPTLRWVDGIHDLGGLDGFGRVEHVAAEPVFAEDWERRAVRVMVATAPCGSIASTIVRGPALLVTSSLCPNLPV